MVAPKQEKILRILNLVAQEQSDRFNGLFAAVNVITKEQVVRLRWETTILKDSQQVVVLAMHITYQKPVTRVIRHTQKSLEHEEEEEELTTNFDGCFQL